MPGLHQGGIKAACEVGQSPALRSRQGCRTHIIHRSGCGIARLKFNGAGRLPLRRILQVQIGPGDVGLPAARERDLGPARGNGAGGFIPLAPLQLAGHQVHAVGIDQRDKTDPGIGKDLCRALAKETAARGEGGAQLLGEFQQQRRGDPLVGVVGGAVQHAVFPRAHGQRPQRTAHHAAAEGGGGQIRIPCRQAPHTQRGERGGKGDVRRHHVKGQRHDDHRAHGQILRREGAVGQLYGFALCAVELGNGIKALARADTVAHKARVPGHQRAVRARPGHPVGGERAGCLKADECVAGAQAEHAVLGKRAKA